MNFDEAFEKLIGHEGLYSNDSRDPGGETKYGVSKRSYPHLDIRNLTLDGAKRIYRLDYWEKCKCELLPTDLRFHIFDAAVNSGNNRAILWLQEALKVEQDGIIGPLTISAAHSLDADKLILKYNGTRLLFMTTLDGWKVFSRGWAKRIAENLLI